MRRLLVACLLLGACGRSYESYDAAAKSRLTRKAPTEVGANAARPDGGSSLGATGAPPDGLLTPAIQPAADVIVPPTTTTEPEPTVSEVQVTPTPDTSPRPPVNAASRSRGSTVQSTAYCLTGHMANGQPTHVGAVAANAWPLGTVLEVSDSPYGPGRFTVEDRIGWGSELDFATPADCGLANQWGRRSVTVQVVQ